MDEPERPSLARTGNTPIRTMRIPDDVWQAALRGTVAEGTTITAVVTEFLRERYPS